MTFLRTVLLSLLPTLAFGQVIQDQKMSIRLDADRHIELIYRGQRLVYVGETYCPNLSRCGPVGLHHVFNLDGSLQRTLEYRFSTDRVFEGIPHQERITTIFDRQGRVLRQLQAHRCTDCDYEIMGVWHWYREGRLVRSVDVSKVTEVQQAVRYAQDANDEDYWPEAQQRSAPKRRKSQ